MESSTLFLVCGGLVALALALGRAGGWRGEQDPIKPPTCSAGKGVDQKAGVEEGGCSLVDRNGHAGRHRVCKSSEEERTWRTDQRLPGPWVELSPPHARLANVSGISRGEIRWDLPLP